MATTRTKTAPPAPPPLSPDAETAPVIPLLTGYASDVTFLASRYKQGGRTVYSLDLSPTEIASLVTAPDVAKPSPGNRAIRPAHAEGFGKYLRDRDDWISPSLMLRAPSSFDFVVREEMHGIQFGTVSMPRQAVSDLHIVDGQHRILGMVKAGKAISEDLDKARSVLATARRVEKGGKAERDARALISKLEAQRERLATQRVNVQIIVESDPKAYRQMFFDIADNALGITASVKARFDSRKVVHRALGPAMEHPLLLGRIDEEGDRIRGASAFWMGAKHVAEIIRTIAVGLDGRVSRRQEDEFDEKDLAEKTKNFFTTLVEAFPQMRALSLGQLSSEDLRKTSLLGSVLFVRVLGGVVYDLVTLHAWKPTDAQAFLAKLAPHTAAPAYVGDIWTTNLPEIYSPGSGSPRSRRQDLTALKNALVAWAIDKPAFVDAPPAERPAEPVEEVDPEFGTGYTDFGLDIPKA